MQKRLFAIFSLLALLAAGCAGQDTADDGGDRPAAGAQTFNVNVDGKSDDINLATLAYFPAELSVHPGDTIEFREIFTGEPHTVTFGTLVEAGLEAVDKMGPPGGAPGAGASPGTGGNGTPSPTTGTGGTTPTPTGTAGGTGATPTTGATTAPSPGANASPGAGGQAGAADVPQPGGPPPEMLKIPDIFGPPPTFEPLNQSAGQPCFLETGDPPVSPQGGAPACPKTEQPEFNGNQTFYNSGYLAEDETFTVKFSDDIRPGDYSFMCLIHRDMMRGKVTVADAGTEIPSAREVAKKGRDELAKTEQAMAKVQQEMQKATPDKARAGGGSPEVMNALVAEFGPKEVSIPTGGTVTWTLFGFHTIALNPPEDAIVDLIQEGDGTIRPNEKAVRPSKAPNPPPIVFGPEAKPSTAQATWDGTGFFNSGTMASFPGAEVTYKLRFTRAGTYQLQCNLHPEMEGTVKVA